MPAQLTQKVHDILRSDLCGAIAFAMTAHFLFFYLLTLQVPILQTQTKTEMAFLGSILDPFEAKTLNNEGTLATDVSVILKKPEQRAGLSVISQNKPNLTKKVDEHSKNFFKSFPQLEKPAPQLPPVEVENAPSREAEPQPYRRLRLYQ